MGDSVGLLLTITFLAWASIITVGKASHNAIMEQISEDARRELDAYLADTMRDIHKVIIGERYHETHDFRIDLEPGHHQCYYQEADAETIISVNFESVDPPTLASKARITASAFSPNNQGDGMPLASIEEQQMGDFEFKTEKEEVYALCFHNKHSSAPAKLQIQIDIWREKEIAKFHKSRVGTNDIVYETFGGLYGLLRSVAVMRSAMSHTNSQLRYDYLTRMSSLSRINNYSLLSVVLIISVCFLQLRMVKKMFGVREIVV